MMAFEEKNSEGESIKFKQFSKIQQIPERIKEPDKFYRRAALGNPICTCIILSFLKFCYVCGLSPFYVVQAAGVYKILNSRKKKVVNVLICCLTLLVYFAALRTTVIKLSKENPVTFFKLFRNAFSFVYKINVLKVLWTKRESFLDILHYLETCRLEPPKILFAKLTIHAVFTLYIVVGVMYGLLGTSKGTCYEPVEPTKTSLEYFSILNFLSYRLRTLLVETRYLFFLSYQCQNIISLTTVDCMCLVFGTLAFISRFLLGFFADLFLLSFILTLLVPTIHFTRRLETVKFEDIKSQWSRHHEINLEKSCCNPLDHYKRLRILSKKINSLIGFTLFTYILEVIFAYPINFFDLVWSPEIFERVLLFLFYCTTAAILICSSEICRRMQSLRNWLFETEITADLPNNDIVLILDDLGQNSVGISASGIFTLNYYFVGTVTSIVLTYFIIRLQWTHDKNGIISDNSPLSV